LRVCGSGEIASAFLKWLDLRAKALVEEHWPAVERLANELLKRGEVTQDEIAALMKQTTGQPDWVESLWARESRKSGRGDRP
jgi:hypothetical protein